ncbi:MAG: hypothetical protein POH28_06330 [Acidocella sp.]|nr:hypothetical protein [Acidocella sp.]
MVVLLLAVLFLFIMPALLYLMGWLASRYTNRAYSRKNFLVGRNEDDPAPDGETGMEV